MWDALSGIEADAAKTTVLMSKLFLRVMRPAGTNLAVAPIFWRPQKGFGSSLWLDNINIQGDKQNRSRALYFSHAPVFMSGVALVQSSPNKSSN
jgi:hypothetical protein